jgi:acyl-CoA thioester hydrolase
MMNQNAHPIAPAAKPSLSFKDAVGADWIDANGHMNVSWYDKVFDAAEKRFFEEFAINDELIGRTGTSFFRLEKFVRYEREILSGDAVEVHSRIIWTDFKRLHHFHELVNVSRGIRAAYADALSIHVDLNTRKGAEIMLPEVRVPFERLTTAQAELTRPRGVLARRRGRWEIA